MNQTDPFKPADAAFNPYSSPRAELKPIAENPRGEVGPQIPFAMQNPIRA